jgi:hypothetical protein
MPHSVNSLQSDFQGPLHNASLVDENRICVLERYAGGYGYARFRYPFRYFSFPPPGALHRKNSYPTMAVAYVTKCRAAMPLRE